MKRVVFGLVGAGCLFAAAVAISQTSVLVAQKEPNGQKSTTKVPQLLARAIEYAATGQCTSKMIKLYFYAKSGRNSPQGNQAPKIAMMTQRQPTNFSTRTPHIHATALQPVDPWFAAANGLEVNHKKRRKINLQE